MAEVEGSIPLAAHRYSIARRFSRGSPFPSVVTRERSGTVVCGTLSFSHGAIESDRQARRCLEKPVLGRS